MHHNTPQDHAPVVSRREAARRLGLSTWTLNKYNAELEIVPQHGVNVAGEAFTREVVTLASVERLKAKLGAAKAA